MQWPPGFCEPRAWTERKNRGGGSLPFSKPLEKSTLYSSEQPLSHFAEVSPPTKIYFVNANSFETFCENAHLNATYTFPPAKCCAKNNSPESD
jgi:hypothetical protein